MDYYAHGEIRRYGNDIYEVNKKLGERKNVSKKVVKTVCVMLYKLYKK